MQYEVLRYQELKAMMCALVIALMFIPASDASLQISELTQTNEGPQNRSRPMLLCHAVEDDKPVCLVVGGATFPSAAFPTVFYNDVWKMRVDIPNGQVTWTQLSYASPPIESSGAFTQFWRHNLTAFAITAGLNNFNPSTFAATCNGMRIVIYDFVNQQFEIRTPATNPFAYHNMTGGACDRYKDSVICWGGFDCNTFQDLKLLTKYNITTNTITVLAPAGFANLTARHHSSVNCDADGPDSEHYCILGSGDKFGGGTIDQWNIYRVNTNTLEFFEPPNKPNNIQYVHPDHQQIWKKINNGDKFKVVRDKNRLLLTGGDNATGASGTSNTVRIVSIFNNNQLVFHPKGTGILPTIKQQYLKNVPRFRVTEDNDDDDDCDYFIEYAGFEENASTALHYPNRVFIYKRCNDD